MTFAQRRISQNLSPSLSDAYLYIHEASTSQSTAFPVRRPTGWAVWSEDYCIMARDAVRSDSSL
jgi:hypothetical protein